MIATYQELVDSLPEAIRTPEVLNGFDDPPYRYRSLKQAYEDECAYMHEVAQRCRKPELHFNVFQQAGSQFTAYFVVNDVDIPYNSNQVNWHLQNLSQCKYNGALLIDRNRVSAHH